MGQKKLLL